MHLPPIRVVAQSRSHARYFLYAISCYNVTVRHAHLLYCTSFLRIYLHVIIHIIYQTYLNIWKASSLGKPQVVFPDKASVRLGTALSYKYFILL